MAINKRFLMLYSLNWYQNPEKNTLISKDNDLEYTKDQINSMTEEQFRDIVNGIKVNI